MKATGIVRRIDGLRRVVIPREIRLAMRIREGDPLEIYTTRDGEIVFKRYNPNISSDLSHYAESIEEMLLDNNAPADARKKAKEYLTGLVKILEHYE